VGRARYLDRLCYAVIESPLGELLALADPEGSISGLYFIDGARTPTVAAQWKRDNSAFSALRRQLASYFSGTRRDFDVPLQIRGSERQRQLWAVLREIPYGQTVSYGELARRLGNARAARAVGALNADNPISIVIPCHRLVSSDGALTGYAGGTWRKARLLALEATHAASVPRT
jgi:methylated-DNA-[protein]-cysteine S-methyltransferase